MKPLISGVHTLIYSHDADADRAFFRDVLGLDSVDSGGGWLIFALPAAALAIHTAGDAVCESLCPTADESGFTNRSTRSLTQRRRRPRAELDVRLTAIWT